jgi:hypothetical protein
VITPSCGPIVAGRRAQVTTPCCSPPRVDCGPTVTLSASRNPAVAGQKVKLTGKLTSVVAGGTVELWQKLAGASSFKEVAHATPGSSGLYTFTRKVETNVQWYVSSGGVDSARVAEDVGSRVTLHLVHRAAATNPQSTYRVHVVPGDAGARVLVQRRSRGTWIRVKRARVNRSSNFNFTYRFPSNGKVTLRFVMPASKRNIRSVETVIVTSVTSSSS